VRREPPHTPPNSRIGESPIQPLTPSRACDRPTAHPPPLALPTRKKPAAQTQRAPIKRNWSQRTQTLPSKQLAGTHDRRKQTVSPPTHQQPLHRKLTPSPSLQHPFTNPRPHPQKPTHPSPSSSKSPTAAPSAPRCAQPSSAGCLAPSLDELYVQLLHTAPDPAVGTGARAVVALWFTELRGVRERLRRELEAVLAFARGVLWDDEALVGLSGGLRWAGFWE